MSVAVLENTNRDSDNVRRRSIRWWMRNFAPYDDRLPWIPYASGAAADLISQDA